ncbi:MAG: hypothetical protein JST50_17100 [Bacteroidetes bacterium]|jgi:hypothetical protein|nr:hypothetical protein [Bacteroidota bacterium]
MKHKLLYLFLLLVIVVAGCIKSTPNNQPAPTPSGKFSGIFKVAHRHTTTSNWDSVKTTLNVQFNTPAYTYAVSGVDTSTLHVASYGTFGISSPYIQFTDQTWVQPVTGTKWHLNGYYLYNYDGTNLIMYVSSGDTLVAGYSLKKTSN